MAKIPKFHLNFCIWMHTRSVYNIFKHSKVVWDTTPPLKGIPYNLVVTHLEKVSKYTNISIHHFLPYHTEAFSLKTFIVILKVHLTFLLKVGVLPNNWGKMHMSSKTNSIDCCSCVCKQIFSQPDILVPITTCTFASPNTSIF